MIDLRRHVVDVPDFPRAGILFRDITPLLRTQFQPTIDALERLLDAEEWQRIDAVAGIESRGFILAAALAARRGKGFVPIRKQGKLPPPIVDMKYTLEYGTGILEMQRGAGRLLLVDDVLATGGSMRAAADLCGAAGYEVGALLALIDLKLAGAPFVWREHALRYVIDYV
jgi:adenine phosphoribosyltransferase